MTERPKVAVLKTVEVRASVGSNPTASASVKLVSEKTASPPSKDDIDDELATLEVMVSNLVQKAEQLGEDRERLSSLKNYEI